MGDTGDDFKAMHSRRQKRRAMFGIQCAGCLEKYPKRCATILLPGQKCYVCGYRDPRDRSTMGNQS